jgi:tetratricopeptide (TPR) repeat protein
LRRAEFRRGVGAWDAAAADCDQAARLDPKSPLAALVRASIRAGRGEFRQAVEDAETALKAARPDGNVHYAAACVWSLAARAAQEGGESELAMQYADRAAALLGDAFEKGSLDLNFQAFNRMLVDPALEPIRRHPLVLELLPVLRQADR